MIRNPSCSDGPIWNVWLAAFHAPSLAVADEIGVFSALRDAPLTSEQLARALSIELRASEAMLGLLAALGFLAQADTRFHLTDVARDYLLPDSPYYWGGFLQRIRDIPLDCNKLISGLRRGAAAGEARVSGELWRAAQPPPEALHSFTHAMHAHSFSLAMRSVPTFDFGGVSRLLDVAGGSGSYSIAATLRNPSLRSTLLDLPIVCDIARSYAEKYGVADRIDTVSADMFVDPWPSDVDRVFFSDIFHDWDDERCQLLAARAHGALTKGGRVMVHEMLLADSKAGPLAAAGYSMVMVFVAEGRQRSAREISEILNGAGFTDVRVTMTAEGYALIDAKKG
jgi:hypothetical protein